MSITTSSSPLAYLSQLLTGSSKSGSSSVLNRLIGGNTDKSTNSIASAINNAINAGKKTTDSSSSSVSNLNLSASILSLLQGQNESGSGSDLMSQIFSSPKESSAESNILAATIAKQILKSAVNGTNQRQALAAQTGGVQSAIDAYNKQFNTSAPKATSSTSTTA